MCYKDHFSRLSFLFKCVVNCTLLLLGVQNLIVLETDLQQSRIAELGLGPMIWAYN